MKTLIIFCLVKLVLSQWIQDMLPDYYMTDICTIDRHLTQPKADTSDSDGSDDEEAEPIRVCYHYDSEFWFDGSNWNEEEQNVLDMIRIFTQGAAQVMRNILSVKRPQKEPMYFYPEDSPIYEELDKYIDIPESFIEDGVTNCDLMILVGLFNEQPNDYYQTFIKQFCIQVSKATNRPQFAVMWFNFRLDNYYVDYYDFDYCRQLVLRAILQSAGFGQSLFPYFKTDPRLVEGDRTYIVSSKAIQAAQEHFGCDDIYKLPLEDDDDGWSEIRNQWWKKTFLFSDLLSSDITGSMNVLTNITLSVFEDSGWYKPNYSFAEDTLWGKNQGCNFLKCDSDGSDTTIQELCTEIGYAMYPFLSRGGECEISEFYYFHCPVYVRGDICCFDPELVGSDELQSTYESVSRNSVAFNSTFIKDPNLLFFQPSFRCFDYSITSTGSIKIQVGDNEVECTQAEEFTLKTISGIYGNLVCPSKRLWEFKRNDCFGDCGRLGYCHAGECICFKGSYKDSQGRCRCHNTDKENCLHIYKNVNCVTDWEYDDIYECDYGTSSPQTIANESAMVIILIAITIVWLL